MGGSEHNLESAVGGGRFIFVGGAPRSGTTLVQNILDSHTDIVGAPEFLHLPEIVELGDHLKASVERGWIDSICTSDEATEAIRGLIEGFLVPFLARAGTRLLSEKTPANVLVFEQLLDLFPKARFVNVVRDPRGTVASLLAVGARARAAGQNPVPYTADAPAAALYVRRCLRAGLAAENAAPGRILRIHYESLVRRPVEEGQRLCAFVGVPWQEQMARPGDIEHVGAPAITQNSGEIWYDRESYYANPHTDSLERWRKTLTVPESLAIRRVFRKGDELAALGYDLSTPPGPMVPRILGHIKDLELRAVRRLRRRATSGT